MSTITKWNYEELGCHESIWRSQLLDEYRIGFENDEMSVNSRWKEYAYNHGFLEMKMESKDKTITEKSRLKAIDKWFKSNYPEYSRFSQLGAEKEGVSNIKSAYCEVVKIARNY